MSEYTKKVYHSILERTAKNLETNNMKCFIADTKEDVLTIVKELLTEGETVSCGGSATLAETGVTELLRSGVYNLPPRFFSRQLPYKLQRHNRKRRTLQRGRKQQPRRCNMLWSEVGYCCGRKKQDSPHSRGRCYTGKASCCADEYRKAWLRDLLSEQGRVYVPCFGRLRGNDRRLQKRVPHMLFLCGNGFSAH